MGLSLHRIPFSYNTMLVITHSPYPNQLPNGTPVVKARKKDWYRRADGKSHGIEEFFKDNEEHTFRLFPNEVKELHALDPFILSHNIYNNPGAFSIQEIHDLFVAYGMQCIEAGKIPNFTRKINSAEYRIFIRKE